MVRSLCKVWQTRQRWRFYTIGGVEAGNGIATNGTVTINTSMNSGEIAIVKIGGKSVKVVVK